jgi:hypothetical protein
LALSCFGFLLREESPTLLLNERVFDFIIIIIRVDLAEFKQNLFVTFYHINIYFLILLKNNINYILKPHLTI